MESGYRFPDMIRRPAASNAFSDAAENKASFFRRFLTYQNERFPVLGHGVLVASFSFSAIAYSRICRGAPGFVAAPVYLAGIFITVSLFLLVRIFDEFKDAADDAAYRPQLPVPRGLVSFRELFVLGCVLAAMQIGVILWRFPQMLPLYAVVLGYLCLMGKEFFIAGWLQKHPFWYVTSHMFIIPLVDIYASGLDWKLAGVPAPKGLIFFFAVSYMNGIVLEIGRKIRAPESEAEGVNTYSRMLGPNRAAWLWIGTLLVTGTLSAAAASYAGYGTYAFAVLAAAFVVCALPAFVYLQKKEKRTAKYIEWASALWTVTMYLTLGGIPMLRQLILRLWT